MRSELATLGRGPGRYGHIVDAVTTQVKVLVSGEIGARVYLRGKQAWRGRLLAAGAPAHFIGARRQRVRVPSLGRRAYVEGKFRPLAITLGGASSHGWSGVVFRQWAHHPGFAGIPFAERAQAALEPEIQGLVDRAFARVVSA